MRRFVLSALAAFVMWRAAEACGPWFVSRAALDPVFWQPLQKSVPELLGAPSREPNPAVFAGMSAGGGAPLAAARRAYQDLARWRSGGFPGVQPEPSSLAASVQAARRAVDEALAARPAAAEAEELRLIRCKVTLREGEARLARAMSEPGAARAAAHGSFRDAREALDAFLATARTAALASEARGWLARCHFLLGDHHRAARIYLDELARQDSVLSRETLLASLRILFPYNGSAARLADHLDEYFDTPRHALFVVDLVTNPVERDEAERRAMAEVGRKALLALQRHRGLFATGKDSERLALAAMRAALYMGDPQAALDLQAAIPADSPLRSTPEARWMLGVAHFLLGRYADAEPHLRAVARSPAAPLLARSRAQLGLLAVYQKLQRPADQLLAAFRYQAVERTRESRGNAMDDGWYLQWSPYAGWSLDLPYLLDVQLSEDELRAARTRLRSRPPLKVELWTAGGGRVVTASYLIDYELALRAARRESYDEAAAAYARLGAGLRAARMRRLASLFRRAAGTGGTSDLQARYAYGAFLAGQPERVFFNDLVWEGFQRYGLLEGPAQERTPGLLDEAERRRLGANERAFRDSQEERWRAFLVLDDVAARAGPTALGRRAARQAIECLDRINTERFGREDDVQAARRRLVRRLRSPEPAAVSG